MALAHGEEAPGARHTFEVVVAALVEFDARSDHEIPHDARDQDLAGRGAGIDACCDVDRQPTQVITTNLTLAGVQAGSQLDPELTCGLQDRGRALNRTGRSVERHDESIAGGVDLAPSKSLELLAYGPVVIIEEGTPVSCPAAAPSSANHC